MDMGRTLCFVMITLPTCVFTVKLCVNTIEDKTDCSHRNLTIIPRYFPNHATWIDLSHNEISALTFSQTLPRLIYLDMSYNKVSRLETNCLKLIPNLKELHLDHNKLSLTGEGYPDLAFVSLQRLRILHLHGNDFREDGNYPEEALGHLKNLVELRIDTFKISHFGSGFSAMKSLKRLLLGFDHCKMIHLANETFRSFKDVNIEVLDLDPCKIVNVEANSFWYLKHLKFLNMSHQANLVPRTAVASMFGLRGRNLTLIQLDELMPLFVTKENKVEHYMLSSDVLQYLADVCVHNFSMKHNEILWYEFGSWNTSRFGSCIQHLDLSENDLYGDATKLFKISSLAPNLKYFDMSRHFSVQRYPHFTQPQSTLLGGIQLHFLLPSTLQYLNLNGLSVNDLARLTNLVFDNATSLREFKFAFNRIYSFGTIKGLQNVSSLDLSGNICGNMTVTFFDDFPGLTSLKMSGSALNRPKDYLKVKGRRLLEPLKRLERIVLSHNDLTFINMDMFEYNTLKQIDLSFNRFDIIPFDLQTTQSLQYLDLSFNSLTVLEQSDMDLLDIFGSSNNLTLNLNGNLLSCGCENLNLILWLYNTDLHIQDRENYICIHEDGSISDTSHTYQKLELYWRKCYGKLWLSLSITCFAILILAISLFYILHLRRTLIVNAVLRLFGLNTLIIQPSRKDFDYDVFLGYSEDDYGYIYHSVCERLEIKHKIKVFITDRDMLPGTSIPQEIVTAVDSSWKVILILTEAFLEDNWCRFITDYAVYVSTSRPSGCVLLVLFDDMKRGDIPPAVLNVVEEKDIFNVSDYMGEEDALWRDVSDHVKHE